MSVSAQAPSGKRWWLVLPADPTKPLISIDKPARLLDSTWDSPCVFSVDRSTAWQVEVSETGQFYTTPAPLSRAQFDYLEFVGNDGVSRLLRFNNLGAEVTV